MSSPSHTVSPAPGSPDPDSVRAQLEKIVSDEVLSKSGRLTRFLTFVVETALDGKADTLKEYTVALNVFDKDDSFDPKTDPIVRVEAGRLRRRIDAYYRSHPSDPVLIRLRKRGYRPVIRWRKVADRNRAASEGRREPGSGFSSVVVLPFRDLSPDQSQEYFCEAITEQIGSILPRFQVHTVAHTSALQFSGTALDVRRIGRELQADLVLEGSVQRSGRQIRVTASVCRASDGLQIWSDSYDRELREVLALQDDLSESIASGLRTVMVEAEGTRYLDGDLTTRWYRIGIGRQRREYEGTLDRTIDAFERATREAGCGVGAWNGLAESLITRILRSEGDVVRLAQRARAAAETALRVDPSSAVAHAVLGALSILEERNWSQAGSMFRKAIGLAPENPMPPHWYAGLCLSPQGHLVDALAQLQTSVSMDPASLWANVDLAFVRYLSGEREQALAQARYVLQFEPRCRAAHWVIGRAHAIGAEYERALRDLEWTFNVGHRPWTGTRGYCHARLGQKDEAMRVIESLRSSPERSAYAIAEVYLGLGDAGRSLTWLQRSVEAQIPLAMWAVVDPFFGELRELPGFRPLADRMSLGHLLRLSRA